MKLVCSDEALGPRQIVVHNFTFQLYKTQLLLIENVYYKSSYYSNYKLNMKITRI